MVRLTTSLVGYSSTSATALGCDGELAIGFVDDQDPGCRVQQPAQIGQRNTLSRRVIGAGDEHHVGPALDDRRDRGIGVEAEVRGARRLDPFGVGAVGDDRVHRIRRDEADRAASRTAEGLQQLLQDLVGSICRPEVFHAEPDPGLHAEVGGQVGAQRHRVAVGIAVQVDGRIAHRGDDVVDERLAGRVRVLVGVQPHRNRQLRRAVGRFAAQVVAQRKSSSDGRLVIARTSAVPPRRARAGLRRWPA